jgi:hypothetical protein
VVIEARRRGGVGAAVWRRRGDSVPTGQCKVGRILSEAEILETCVRRERETGAKRDRRAKMFQPPERIELSTFCLRSKCTTTVLSGRFPFLY